MHSFTTLFLLSASILLALAAASPVTSDLEMVKVMVQSIVGEDLEEDTEVNLQQIPVSEAAFRQNTVSEAVVQENAIEQATINGMLL